MTDKLKNANKTNVSENRNPKRAAKTLGALSTNPDFNEIEAEINLDRVEIGLNFPFKKPLKKKSTNKNSTNNKFILNKYITKVRTTKRAFKRAKCSGVFSEDIGHTSVFINQKFKT